MVCATTLRGEAGKAFWGERPLATQLVSTAHLPYLTQNEDFTPTLYACHKGNFKILELLLAAGGDLSLCSKKGVTALHLAASSGKVDMVQFLIDIQR